MAKVTKIDFSILTMPFEDLSEVLLAKVEEIQNKKEKTTDEIQSYEDCLRATIKSDKNKKAREEALAVIFNAVNTSDIKTLQEAFNQGVSVNLLNTGGFSLLSFAVREDKDETVDFLLSKSADPCLKGKQEDAFSALEQATIINNLRVFNKLAKAGAKVDKEKIVALAKKNAAYKILKALKS